MKMSLLKKLLNHMEENLETTDHIVNSGAIASLTVGNESSGFDVEVANRSGKEFDENLKIMLHDLTLSTEGDVEFTEVQQKAANVGARMALDPSSTYIGNRELTEAKRTKGSKVIQTIGLESYHAEDILTSVPVLSKESFDGQLADSAIYTTFAYNLFLSKQSDAVETFFPTIVIDPSASGISVEAPIAVITDEFLRDKAGTSDKSKFNRRSIAKQIGEGKTLAMPKNKLVPVSRSGTNDNVLDNTTTFTDGSNGTDITTAPIIFGKTLGLLGVSQTDEELVKGVRNNTDSLDRRVKLKELFFSLTNSTPTTEKFRIDVSGLPGMNFTYSTQGHNKDIMLSYTGEAILIKTGTTTPYDTASSTILDGLAANHTIKFNVVLNGSGNTQDGDIVVYASSVTLGSIKDSAGNLVTAGATFDAIKAVTDTITLIGYTVEAYSTESNLRNMPMLIDVDVRSQLYTVPVRSGSAILRSAAGNVYDTDDAANRLGTQISITGYQMEQDGISTLVDHFDFLNVVTQGGTVTDIELEGIGHNFVDPYYSSIAFNAVDFVDSMNSKDRFEDIGGAITNKIRDEIIKMSTKSNYGIAHKFLFGNMDKIGVGICTSSRVGAYIDAETINAANSDFDVKVTTITNTLIGDKVYITFVDMSSTKNTKINPIGFGFTAYSPELSVDVVTSGSGVTRQLRAYPRFLHVAQTSVGSVLTVTGLEEALKKITQNNTTV